MAQMAYKCGSLTTYDTWDDPPSRGDEENTESALTLRTWAFCVASPYDNPSVEQGVCGKGILSAKAEIGPTCFDGLLRGGGPRGGGSLMFPKGSTIFPRNP